jgi:uncharacterized protein YlbG (UPF0298 family)
MMMMRSKLRPFLIILTTLLIGFGLGVLSVLNYSNYNGGHHKYKHKKEFKNFGHIDHFKEKMYALMEVTPTQKPKIDPILQKHFKNIEGVTATFFKNIDKEMDAILKEATPHLTPQQIKKAEEKRAKFKENFRKKKGK